MIHITDENKKYYFPIDIQPTDTDSFILNLYSELSLSDITFNELSGEVEDDYIGIVITTEMAVQVPNGEYNYTLYDGEGERVGIGLIRFDLEDGGTYPDEPEYVVYDDEMDGGYITTQNQEEAFNSGYDSGYTDCYPIAYESGYTDGYESGMTDGVESGYTSGYTTGYSTGYDEGFDDGVDSVPLVATGFTQNGVYLAPEGGYNEISVSVPDNGNYFYFEAITTGVTVELRKYEQAPEVSLEYSFDKSHWSVYTINTPISVENGSKIYFRGDNPNGFFGTGSYNNNTFVCAGKVNIGGDIRSLIDPTMTVTALPQSCFRKLFTGCNIVSADKQLFSGIKTLALECFKEMFFNCALLVDAPDIPNVTMATSCCFDMFGNCSSLVNAPVFPAATLADGCYRYMFRSCTSLTTAPVLPATTLATRCYQNMFAGCTSLNYIKCLAIQKDRNTTIDWLKDVSPTGTFVKAFGTDWESGVNGIPEGWNVLNDDTPITGTTINSNGVFLTSGTTWDRVEVNVPTGITPSGTIQITENGTYDVTDKASANVQIPVENYWQSGYTSGYTDGYDSGYTDGYQSGYTDGEESVPLVSTGFTSNGIFSAAAGGFNVVTVNVPTGITPSGSISIVNNGTYNVTDKASAVVNVTPTIVSLTQTQYDNLSPKDPNTIYLITE